MYANINAGLSALAPEANPMDTADTGFGARNRAAQFANLQQTYAPLFQNQQNAMAEQARILGSSFTPFSPQTSGPFPVLDSTAPLRGGVAVPPTNTTRPPVTPQPPVVTQPPITSQPVTYTDQNIRDYLSSNANMTDAQIRTAMDQFGVGVDQMAAATGLPVDQVQQRYDTASNFNNQNIQDYLGSNPNMTDAQIREAMDQFGVGTAQMAAATGLPFDQVQQRYEAPSQFSNQAIQSYLGANPNMSDAQIRSAMDQFGVGTAQMAAATGLPMDQVQQRYDYAGSTPAPYTPQGNVTGNLFEDTARDLIAQTAATTQPGGYSNQDIQNYLAERPGLTDSQIRLAMDRFGVGIGQMAAATGLPMDQVQQRYTAAGPTRLLNQGGIAALAKGGYPRRNGQISGPGTEKSDSIPAMLSDGEFVMTAKAVRGAGKGNRRAGAKQMYKLMHQLEKNAERG